MFTNLPQGTAVVAELEGSLAKAVVISSHCVVEETMVLGALQYASTRAVRCMQLLRLTSGRPRIFMFLHRVIREGADSTQFHNCCVVAQSVLGFYNKILACTYSMNIV